MRSAMHLSQRLACCEEGDERPIRPRYIWWSYRAFCMMK